MVTHLITARVIQGVGGAMILPSTLSTVNATFQGKARAAVFGLLVFGIIEGPKIGWFKPIAELKLLSLTRSANAPVSAAFAVAVGEFGLVFIMPLYLVNALGLSIMGAGWVLAAMVIGAFFSGAMARHVAAAVGAASTVVIGLVAESAALKAE